MERFTLDVRTDRERVGRPGELDGDAGDRRVADVCRHAPAPLSSISSPESGVSATAAAGCTSLPGAATKRAVQRSAHAIDGPIRLAGHSAGGQLVTRLLGADRPLPPALRDRIERVLSISGVHDLEPLLETTMNHKLGLDGATALAASPLHHPPAMPRR